MATAKCFRCGTGYPSVNPDEIAGDGKCENCKELSKKVAFEVDMKMAARRKNNPLSRLQELGITPDGKPNSPIKARNLGINFGS